MSSRVGIDPASTLDALVLDQAGVAVITTNDGGLITGWNRQAEAMFGWSREEAVGRMFSDLLPAPSEAAVVEEIAATVHSGTIFEGDLPMRRKDGATMLCHVVNGRVTDADGAVVASVAVCSDVTVDLDAERRLAARTGVTSALAGALSLEEAAPRVIRAVCENLGWVYGGLWEVDRSAGLLRCVDAWDDGSLEISDFVRATRNAAFPAGTGLPGRVWATGDAHWIPDVTTDSNFPRAASAARGGLHAAVGFPITLSGHLLGVLEFFGTAVMPPNDALLQTMGVIGSQIAQFMERVEAERGLRRSEGTLRAIVEAALDGLVSIDQNGRVVEFNPAAEAMFGRSRDEVLGREMADAIIPERLRDDHRRGLARYLETGKGPILDSRVELMALRADGTEFPVELAVSRIDVPGPPSFTGFVRDITERKRAEDAQRFLAETGPLLAAAVTDYEQTLARIAELAVPRLADWCAIHVAQEDGSARSIKVAHSDPEKVRLAEELNERYPPDPDSSTGVFNVLRTGRSEIYPEILPQMIDDAAVDDEHRRLLQSLQFTSAIVVPLAARGQVLGAITLVYAESGRRYGPEDLGLAEDLATRAAVAMQNAQLYADRDHIARTLQRSLLPPDLPVIPHVEVAARYRAAGAGNEVGGDFYDVFETAGGNWAVVIGDVCGKGPEAAAVTGLARHTLRATATHERTPSAILHALNDALLRERDDQVFITVVFLRLRPGPSGTRATVCCGGHPLPLVLRRAGSVEPVGRPGSLVGIFADPEFHDRVVDLEPGDAIVMFTDGVTEEHAQGETFGRTALTEVVRRSAGETAEGIATAIERAVVEFRPESLRDDVAILVVKARG
jgi:PAS domain S-box-containing protein